MRSLTISLIAIGVCFTLFTNMPAQAGMVKFDFQALENTNDDSEISRYMTRVMGSKVICDDAEVRDNWDGDYPYWKGKNGWDDYLRCDTKTGDIEIIFSKPITRVKGEGYAFYTQFGYDYHVRGYDASYGGDHENPNAESMIYEHSIYTGSGHEAPFDITFDKPVTLLVLSNGGKEWIGVDNLYVQPVPEPAAALLASLGMGLTGWLKRRKTL